MSKIITYSFCDPFIDRFADDLERDYLKTGSDLSRIAIVFGGRRPALFVKRQLAQKIKKAFYPPGFFSIDEFMSHITAKHDKFQGIQDLDQCYLMYRLAKEKCPLLLKNRERFARFLPWAREILAFIEQLDLECVDNLKLEALEQNARIGYDVPKDVNDLLAHITVLREAYHEHMRHSLIYTRGFYYLRAKELIGDTSLDEFDQVLFANFFYFNRSEEAVVKTLYDRGQARLFFQGDQRRWPVLERTARLLNSEIKEGNNIPEPAFDLKIYRGFDTHSQVCQLREILKTIPDLSKTVVVLPDPDHIIPLLSEIGPMVEDFNISMGYPLKRSSLVSLLEQMFAAQISKSEHGYYAHDYLKVLRHPLIKNTVFGNSDFQCSRVLIHKIEEALTGLEESVISGCVFVKLEDVMACEVVFERTQQTLASMGIECREEELVLVLKEIHKFCFSLWEQIGNFKDFSLSLHDFIDVLMNKSVLKSYPLNMRIASKVYDIIDELKASNFACESFALEELFRVFSEKIAHEIVSFNGSPLKGLQILGLFETRSLNFDHVIVLDANEGVLPRLKIYESLVPRDVMVSLNLDRLEQEEEIQRYGFMRLISSAKEVHLIYQENRESERSRFIEELIWQEEKRSGCVSVPVKSCGFIVKAKPQKSLIQKTPDIIEFLRRYRYSASSINTYLRDPIEFYYQYVLGLREQDDLLDEPENRQVGVYIHEILEAIFKGFVNRKPVLDHKFLNYANGIMEAHFQRRFGRSKRPDLFFLQRVIGERMRRFFEVEARRCEEQVESVLYVEHAFEDTVPLKVGPMNFVYKIDRVDRLIDGTILLIDYKTGNTDIMPGKMESLDMNHLKRDEILEVVKSVQLPLYFHYLLKTFRGKPVDAGLYNLRECQIKRWRRTTDLETADQEFLQILNAVMEEILNPDVPFTRPNL
ncbi:MAG: PD-(D/E)XK nuclease family protein [Candidatus Omnitrophota bacterium]